MECATSRPRLCHTCAFVPKESKGQGQVRPEVRLEEVGALGGWFSSRQSIAMHLGACTLDTWGKGVVRTHPFRRGTCSSGGAGKGLEDAPLLLVVTLMAQHHRHKMPNRRRRTVDKFRLGN
jgi:hypothetical protein